MTPPDSRERAVQVCGVHKAFGGTVALQGIDLDIRAGEIVGLVGDNGAGKSTLVKTIAGVIRPDAGEILIETTSYRHLTAPAARALGIEVIHQDLGLVEEFDAVANLFLNRETVRGAGLVRRFGWMDRRRMVRDARETLGGFGLYGEVLRRPTRQLSGGQRQMVAIARAVHWHPRVVMMDEPTAALSVDRAKSVLELARNLAASGIAILFVSHDIAHVLALTHQVVVLRHGRKVAQLTTTETTHAEIVMFMTGHEAQK